MRFLRKSWWRSLSPEAQAALIKGGISFLGFAAYVGLIVYVAKKEGRGLNLSDLGKIIEHIPSGEESFRFKPDVDLTRRLVAAVQTPTPVTTTFIEGEVIDVDVDEWHQKALEAGALVEEPDPPIEL